VPCTSKLDCNQTSEVVQLVANLSNAMKTYVFEWSNWFYYNRYAEIKVKNTLVLQSSYGFV
jgi:hypothetical protein